MGRRNYSILKLRNLLGLLILIIFIPVFTIQVTTGLKQYQSARQNAENNARQIINHFIDEQKIIANQTRQFLKLVSRVPSINELDISEGNKFLQEIHQYYPHFSTIVVADSEGSIDICAIPLQSTIDVKDRSWFKRIKKSRDFVIDNFIISRSAKKASLPFAYPIFHENGELKAAVGAAYNLEHYVTMFAKHPLPPDSMIMVISRDDKLLYNPENQTLIGMSLEEAAGIVLPDSNKGSFTDEDESGIQRIFWYERLSVGQESNEICLLIGISKKEMFSDVYRSLLTNTILIMIVAIVSVCLSWLFGKKFIIRPIQLLVEKTQRIQEGNLRILKDDETFPGELQSLSKAFDIMTENLSNRETERDLAEETLKENEERLRILFHHAADAIYVSDHTGRLLQCNKKATIDTGYSDDELLNKYVWELDSQTSSREAYLEILKSFSPGDSVTIESSHFKKDGTVFPVEVTVSQSETREGIMVIGIARDITERRKWQLSIEHSLSEKETLLRELHHRTKNNMQVIRSILLLNAAKYSNPEIDELVLNTENRIMAMSLVHEMLYQSDNLSKIKLNDYIKELTEMIVQSFNSRDLKISIDFDMEDIFLLIDSAIPLGIVLNELITNSLKHAFPDSDSGRIAILMHCQNQDKIKIVYTDTGKGIPEDFKYSDNESLGLNIVTGIIEQQLAGTVQFEHNTGMKCSIVISDTKYTNSLKE